MQAPGFTLQDMKNNEVKLSDYKGKLVCINFWGTYCSPCIKSIPQKNEMVKKYNPKNFVLLNICIDNDLTKWKELINSNEFKGIHLRCPGNWSGLLSKNYRITGIPHYTLIDKSGKIIADDIHRDSLEYYIEENLK